VRRSVGPPEANHRVNNRLEFNPACSRSRWLGYFDLLGTRELIRSGDTFRVFSVYEKALREVRTSKLPIQRAWFSDTFLIYSQTDGASDFWAIDSISRWFVYFLIMADIPVRGAIASGDFYADDSSQVYFGEALVESYEFGEAQDWIGFLLCPSSVARLDALKMPANSRLNYAYAEIPFKKSRPDRPSTLPACILGNWTVSRRGQNDLLDKLRLMKQKQPDRSIARKYENTIAFIERNQRLIAQTGQHGDPPNGGPAEPIDNSEAAEGPPSVS